ncbi:MAG: NAD-dependent epimerase/dehydratase family protein [Alphaproteobacteria bacterium]|nr:NAD-dependent epimerase/dehydratase family protein [Alphaproteobacteria bacterium]
MTKVLVTGVAGFIGFHVAKTLLKKGEKVIGIDNLNAYYSVELKEARLNKLSVYPNFHFYKEDISSAEAIEKIWKKEGDIEKVVHLAAQAGVRYSLTDPYPYIASNLMGFTVILERCRHQPNFKHLVYASTSSIYGDNKLLPFTEDQQTDSPISLYAATKKANELMAQSYWHLYQFPITGLRLFTVYGPWGRPDMALFKFTKAILDNTPIDVYNNGDMARDYTYVDDIVNGILKALEKPSVPMKTNHHPIYNLGNKKRENLLDFIEVLEKALNKKAVKNFLPLQAGDILETFSDINKAESELGYSPLVPITEGIPKFVNWYHSYYKL